MARGVGAHRERIALLMAADAAGVLVYRYCTPLPAAEYVVEVDPGGERRLAPAQVVPYVGALVDTTPFTDEGSQARRNLAERLVSAGGWE